MRAMKSRRLCRQHRGAGLVNSVQSLITAEPIHEFTRNKTKCSFRVGSWIEIESKGNAIHEITRINTKLLFRVISWFEIESKGNRSTKSRESHEMLSP